jgi:hypothetical protein
MVARREGSNLCLLKYVRLFVTCLHEGAKVKENARRQCPPVRSDSRFFPSFPPSSLFQDRITLTCWSYLPQATLWAAANTNILTFSAGILGPELFNLPLKTCVGVIIGFNILAVLPVAYLSVSNSSCFVIYAREVEKGVLIDSAPSFSLP